MSTISSIADIARVHAEARPDKVAMIYQGAEWTYAQLDSESNRVANALLDALSLIHISEPTRPY